MAAIIINDVMARALYPTIIFICYYLFSIPMGCLRMVFKLLLDFWPIRDQRFFSLLKIERQITTWPQDRKCNYFNFSCLYSDVYNYCYPCCRLSNIPSPFREDSWLWCFRDGHWCRKGYYDLLRVELRVWYLAKQTSVIKMIKLTLKGAFVASNAMASSDAKSTEMKLNRLILTKSLPLLVVGIIRWASTAAMGYHVDASEYGVHWNFFFSLFVVKVAGYFFKISNYN